MASATLGTAGSVAVSVVYLLLAYSLITAYIAKVCKRSQVKRLDCKFTYVATDEFISDRLCKYGNMLVERVAVWPCLHRPASNTQRI